MSHYHTIYILIEMSCTRTRGVFPRLRFSSGGGEGRGGKGTATSRLEVRGKGKKWEGEGICGLEDGYICRCTDPLTPFLTNVFHSDTLFDSVIVVGCRISTCRRWTVLKHACRRRNACERTSAFPSRGLSTKAEVISVSLKKSQNLSLFELKIDCKCIQNKTRNRRDNPTRQWRRRIAEF